MITMNAPLGGTTPLDADHALTGQPLDRIDGPAKVQGHVPYAYEYRDLGNTAYAFIVSSGIGKGRLADIDTAAAERAPGVLLVMTHKNAAKQGAKTATNNPQLASDEIKHHGQPIALVVAESFEQARAAAFLVKPRYADETGAFDMRANLAKAFVPKPTNETPPDTHLGTFDAAFGAAPVKIDATYTTPAQSHAMMEPHATIATWDGDQVTLYTANQMLIRGLDSVSSTLRIPKEKIRLISRYVGGGFGAKLAVQADAILAALAARELKRPVKLALTRPQVFHVTTHRTDTIQTVRLGAERDGTLTAIGHDVTCNNTGRGLLRDGGRGDPRALRRAQPRHDAPAGVARPAGVLLHARAGRGGRPAGAGKRDGRACRRARHGPDRAAHQERAARGPGKEPAVLHPHADPLHAEGRGVVRLEQARDQARPACATASGSSAWACRRPCAATRCCRPRRASAWARTGSRR